MSGTIISVTLSSNEIMFLPIHMYVILSYSPNPHADHSEL